MKPVKNVLGVANYLFKHTKRPERKAELTPESFRGKMYTVSKGFLTKPFRELWREVKSANEVSPQTSPSLGRSTKRL